METRVVIVTAVNDYRPDLCEYTIPNLKSFADRCKADFIVNRNRARDLKWHPAYEKTQAWEIADLYDKTIIIDADLIIHPKMTDFFAVLPKNHTGSWMSYEIKTPSLTLWDIDADPYFSRDGRNVGIVGSIVGCNRSTRHIFEPLSARHDPVEAQAKLYRPAIIDEYTFSRNLAKYGLKHAALWPSFKGIHHAEVTTKNDKNDVEEMIKTLRAWGCL
jgi:alpha-N-acetylglucosamine transferase